MRYAADQKEKTRQKIVEAAAVVFRRQGFQAGSVDNVMAEAGLTAGGFYAHFESKDELFAAALIDSLRQARIVYGKDDEHLQGPDRIRSIAAKYLSPAHRTRIDQGCAMPPLLAELPRHSATTRKAFEQVLGDVVATLTPHLAGAPGAAPTDRMLALLALLVGGMSLARAVDDEQLADRILAACRQLADASLLETATVRTKATPKPTKRNAPTTKSPTHPMRKPRS